MNVSDRAESNPAPDRAVNHVHVTFSFHCAVLRLPDRRLTDVMLAPGGRHGVASGAAGNGHADHGGSNGTTVHKAEHIASMRIPAECVEKDETREGIRQVTARLGRADIEDVTWRLEKYAVTLRTSDEQSAAKEPPANVTFTTSADDVTYMVPDFPKLASMKIDPLCHENGAKFPTELRQGARVRLTGGTLECGVPSGPLKQRRWKVGTAENVGLSDRMEYRKDLTGDGLVELTFRKFDDEEAKDVKTVYLKPGADGIVRIHVSNDPFAEDPPQGSRQIDPCSALKHFASYSLLLIPAGEDKSDRLSPPTALGSGAGDPMIVSEGSNSACCPCGSDGGGNP
jgi:hypothetical protein